MKHVWGCLKNIGKELFINYVQKNRCRNPGIIAQTPSSGPFTDTGPVCMSQFRTFLSPKVLKSENHFSNDISIGSITY